MRITLGGCVGNTGRALSDLGMSVRAHAAVGDDVLGVIVRDSLLSLPGVDARLHVDDAAGTSYSIVVETPGTDRAFLHHTGANDRYTGAEIAFRGELAIHLGYPQLLDAMLANGARALVELLARARANGVTTSVDFANAKPGTSSAESMQRLLTTLLPLVDVFSPSVEDLVLAMPELVEPAPDRLSAVAAALCERGAAVVLLKAGPNGAGVAVADASRLSECGRGLRHIADEAGLCTWVAASARKVVHTTGAGDVASAAFLHSLLRGGGVKEAALASQQAAAGCVEGVTVPRQVVRQPASHHGGR